MPERIVVTGASSYLGRRVVARLAERPGAQIVALCSPRDPDAGDGEGAGTNVRRIRASLAAPLSPPVTLALRAADRVLHFAWDRRGDAVGAIGTNAAMVENLLAICRPEALVFVSSVAGAPDAASAYGRHKHALAERVRAAGGSVFVPGLVVEDPPAGPYAILTRVVAGLPLALHFTRGAPQVYPVTMARLLDMVDLVADPDLPPGTWRGFDAPVGINDFLRALEARHPRARLSVAVSARLLINVARMLKRVPLPTRAYCDKILTFLQKNDAHLALTSPLAARLDRTQPNKAAS
ncbi:MAG: NAD-dependent epimerase/dehydratase family protein [Gemmobacter sp.]